jgi:hydrogenase maturation protein HypF
MKELGFPIVATSGNLSDEPICTDEHEALTRLNDIADGFLVHNRPIVRHVDDSIVRVIFGREMVVRRARGYAPLPVTLNNNTKKILAVGAHLKNTISVNNGNNVFISQHIGDLETAEAFNAFERVIRDLTDMYETTPEAVSCDMHPDYISTSYARNSKIPVISVQHHFAHIASCMAENDVESPALGVSWDGTGYGTDGTIWGGEFLLVNEKSFERIAHLRTFRLPGGEKAMKEINRSAIGLLFEIYREKLFDLDQIRLIKDLKKNEKNIFTRMLKKAINSPITSSAGRLFDAVAYITGVSSYSHFEGQAAMQLEFETDRVESNEIYDFRILDSDTRNSRIKYIADWEPMILDIIKDVDNEVDRGLISAKFHNTLSNIMLELAKLIGEKKIVLSGGCFQNKYLAERTISLLMSNGFKPYWHQRVPPNDGGISLGQIAAASKSIDQGVTK